MPDNEQREDWRLLMLLLQDRCGSDFDPKMTSDESLSNLERFVNQMDVVSFKILKEYSVPVNAVMKKWKEEARGSSESSSSSSESDDEDRKKNDFRIDRKRIKAAHYYEKTNDRLTFDPDQDGFNFGYEKALTFKVRVNMLKIVRKEVLAHSCRFWDHS